MNSLNVGREFTILMALLMSIVAISIDAMLPALDLISYDLQLAHENHKQYVVGFIFIGLAVGQLIFGPLSDATGRKPTLYTGIVIFLLGSLVCYFSTTFTGLLCGRLIQGFGVAGPYVSVVSIVRDKYAGREMAKVMSFIMMIFIMVPAIAPALGQAILYIGSWRDIFLMYLVYSITIGTWIYFRFGETLPKEHRIPYSLPNMYSGLKTILGNRRTVLYTICMGICFGSFIGYLNSSQQIFQVQFGTGKLFALYFGILALILGVASLMNSKYVEKLGMKYICIKSFRTITFASAIFLTAHYFVDIKLWMFLVYAGVLFFSFGLVFGNLNALAMEPMGEIAGIASAIIGSISSIMSMVIGAVIGQLYNGTLIPIVAGFLVFGLLALILLIYAQKLAEQAE